MNAIAAQLRRRASARRSVVLLLSIVFFGTVGLAAIFGLQVIASTTSAHSRLTETAQAAAYAGASAARDPAHSGAAGVILIDPAEAERRARAVIQANLDGSFGLDPSRLQSVEIQVHNVYVNAAEGRQLVDPATCAPRPGVGTVANVAWRDAQGECHFTSGVTVRLRTNLSRCLFRGYAQKVCDQISITGDGYADYAFREIQRQ